MAKLSAKKEILYKGIIIKSVEEYGEIQERRNYDVEIMGKNRKYPTIILHKTRIDLVDALEVIT